MTISSLELSPKCSLMSYFDVNNNKMSDKIPTWICNNTNIDTPFLRNIFLKVRFLVKQFKFGIQTFLKILLRGLYLPGQAKG